jgi:hypothetical protein
MESALNEIHKKATDSFTYSPTDRQDRIHDDYIAAVPFEKRNKLPQICGLPRGD